MKKQLALGNLRMTAVGTLLPRTCATARPQLAKADTAFPGASVGQPIQPCLSEQIGGGLGEAK